MSAQPPKQQDRQAHIRRYLQEESNRRSELMFEDAEKQVRDLRTDCAQRKDVILAASRREFDSLEHSVRISTVGPAKREADVMTSRKMGEAVERILDQCLDRLRNYAAGPVFPAALAALLTETVVQARELLHAVDLKSVQGRISVAPQDVEVCRSLADQQGLACEIVGDDSVWGGVEFLSADKRYHVRNTLESRLARQESELRSVATKRIQHEVAKLAASAAPPE